MYNKAVFPSKYLQGQGVIKELPNLVNLFGSRGLILASQTVKKTILPIYLKDFSQSYLSVTDLKVECCEDELQRIDALIEKEGIDVMIGMGGGKVTDTAKIAADRRNIPVIIAPTIASTDAPCSGCAVLYTPDGIFIKVLYQKRNPTVVLVDMNIIAEAPPRFIVAGMGDALSTWFEARSCFETKSMNECGGISTLAGLNLAKLCYDTLLKYGLAAKKANEEQVVTPALNYITEANTLLSGIGFESSGLAAAHAIHNGLTALGETHAYYHGEKVTFGVLTGLHLNKTADEEIQTVYSFCEAIGLPTMLSEIGIIRVERECLLKAAEKTCEPGSPIYHEPCDISTEIIIDAMIAADAYGRRRKLN